MNKDITTMQSAGYVAIPYPFELRKRVEEAVGLWKKFCELPVDVKKGLPYSNGGAGVGYEIKDGSGPKGDHKENFDVTLAGKKWIEETGRLLPDVVREKTPFAFTTSAANLVHALKPMIIEFAKSVERNFGLAGFADEVTESEDAFFVRFIHYFGDRRAGEETASAHVDQSGFTLHLFESHAGLQCLTYEGEWIDMPVSEGETVIIPSMQLQLRSEGQLHALCHRVIANDVTAVEGRWSAVCFIQLKNTPKYDKDAHGRLQEKKPGFNYGMAHAEFGNLFKK